LGGQFVWDDETLVVYNPYIKDWSHLPAIFMSRLGSMAKEAGAFYRPVQTFTYLVDYSFGRLNAVVYHAVSMVWHILAALSVFGLIQILFKNGKLSLLSALLFIVHPIHTEAVSYISGRADSLAAFFMLSSFILYLKHDERRESFVLVGMALSYVLALLSRENSLILLPLVLFYHYAFTRPINKKAFGLLIGVLIGYILWRLLVIGTGSVAVGTPPTFFERLPGVFISLTNYYRILWLPFGLHMEHGGLLFSFSEPKAIIGIVLSALILFYVLSKRSKDPFLFFAAGWFVITLLPSSNLLFPINAYMAEHWLYIPSVGFILIVARFLISLSGGQKVRGFAFVAIVGILAFYSVLTVRQNSYWSNGINFYKRMLHYAPHSSRLYNNLAKAYHDAGKNDELIEILKSAIQLQSDNALAHNNLGNAYKGIGDMQGAIRSYNQAIAIDPGHAGPYYNLSMIYSDMDGKEEDAIAFLNRSLELSPNFSKAYTKLGLIYLKRGETEKAIKLLNRARGLDPDDPEIYHSLGYVYVQTGDHPKAMDMYLKAIEAEPNYVQAYHDLAIIYYTKGRYAQAVEYCDKAVALGHVNQTLLEALKAHR
ncbi:MAG: tetratricopeptide repeat protein, partial [Candidatus Omnitrophica bacterium]|nr:tetratricopeptide repeat protein [Candidatus Omnitrophota bacterium]